MLTASGGRSLLEQYPVLGGDVQVVDDYDEVKEVLGSDAFVQAAHRGGSAGLMRGVLNLLDGPEHLQRRRALAPLLSRAALAGHQRQTLDAVVAQALAELAAGRGPDGVVRTDLVELVWRMLHRLGARIAGIDGLDDPAAADRFVALVKHFGRALTVEWARVEDRPALLAAGEAALHALDVEFYRPSVAPRRALVERHRGGALRDDALPRDLVTVLERHRDDRWPAHLPLREVCVFLMAASATTSHAFPRFVVQLEQWMTTQDRSRDELLADDALLRDAVLESLRTFVASPARLRQATRDAVLTTGRKVLEGQVLALFFRPASERYAAFGPHAERFDPLRRVEATAPWGLAFGAGAHACPGRPLVVGSKHEQYLDGTLMTLARALYGAGLRLDPDRPVAPDASTYYDALASVPVVLDRL